MTVSSQTRQHLYKRTCNSCSACRRSHTRILVRPITILQSGLYEGFGTLAIVSQLLVDTGAFQALPPLVQQQIAVASQEAVTNYEAGLAAIPGEAGSLHGALNVFEHKFADSLPFDLLF
jgi:hypothetical protein